MYPSAQKYSMTLPEVNDFSQCGGWHINPPFSGSGGGGHTKEETTKKRYTSIRTQLSQYFCVKNLILYYKCTVNSIEENIVDAQSPLTYPKDWNIYGKATTVQEKQEDYNPIFASDAWNGALFTVSVQQVLLFGAHLVKERKEKLLPKCIIPKMIFPFKQTVTNLKCR